MFILISHMISMMSCFADPSSAALFPVEVKLNSFFRMSWTHSSQLWVIQLYQWNGQAYQSTHRPAPRWDRYFNITRTNCNIWWKYESNLLVIRTVICPRDSFLFNVMPHFWWNFYSELIFVLHIFVYKHCTQLAVNIIHKSLWHGTE
jgi:hypothetical protein